MLDGKYYLKHLIQDVRCLLTSIGQCKQYTAAMTKSPSPNNQHHFKFWQEFGVVLLVTGNIETRLQISGDMFFRTYGIVQRISIRAAGQRLPQELAKRIVLRILTN